MYHVRLSLVVEGEHIDDIEVVRGQAGLRTGQDVVGVNDRHVDIDAGVVGLELLVERVHEVDERRVLVDEHPQPDVVLGGCAAGEGRDCQRGRCGCDDESAHRDCLSPPRLTGTRDVPPRFSRRAAPSGVAVLVRSVGVSSVRRPDHPARVAVPSGIGPW